MILQCTAERTGKLYSFLRGELNMSSTLIARLKWKNALFVDGKPAHTNHAVLPGNIIRVVMDEQAEGFPAEKIPLEIIYEDAYIIALDKPAGMLMHPSPSRNTGTLANGLRHYYESTAQPCAIHPISRLDRDTFGVVLLAKSSHVHAAFCKLHREGGLQKRYEACVFGAPKADTGVIELPIGRVGSGSLLRKIDPTGQAALTRWQVLARWPSSSRLLLEPCTGRTHQLRLHCMASGFPIVGDPQYASAASAAFSSQYALTAQQLCAKTLDFVHPLTKHPVHIESRQQICCPEAEHPHTLLR